MSLRMVLALALLVGLVYLVGASDVLHVLARIEPQYIVYLLLLSVVLIWVSCVKWRLFIRAWGHDASVLHLMKIYTITYFYNVFAPSFLMGDLARSYHLGKKLENQRDAFVATFLERLTGLLAMVLLGTMFVAVGARATNGVEAAILAAAFLVLVASLVLFSEMAYNFATSIALSLTRLCGLKKITAKLEKLFSEISKAVDTARRNEALFAKAMLWSVFFHFGTVVNTYVAARAIGWENPDFGGLCIIVPLVLLVGIAPITPSGIGIQEGAFMFFLQRIGATRPESLGVGLVLRAKMLVTGFVGYCLWLTLKRHKSTDAEDSTGILAQEKLAE
ncbi:MAG: lysylphosphatidylglycerol synthase transmembrane domain-containing protein [Bdellovibrionota bacterium]